MALMWRLRLLPRPFYTEEHLEKLKDFMNVIRIELKEVVDTFSRYSEQYSRRIFEIPLKWANCMFSMADDILVLLIRTPEQVPLIQHRADALMKLHNTTWHQLAQAATSILWPGGFTACRLVSLDVMWRSIDAQQSYPRFDVCRYQGHVCHDAFMQNFSIPHDLRFRNLVPIFHMTSGTDMLQNFPTLMANYIVPVRESEQVGDFNREDEQAIVAEELEQARRRRSESVSSGTYSEYESSDDPAPYIPIEAGEFRQFEDLWNTKPSASHN